MTNKAKIGLGPVVLGALLLASPASGQSLAGLWDAAVKVNDLEIPFRMEIAADGASLKASLFNGDERLTSAPSRLENGAVVFAFDAYASKLEATVKDDGLEGRYVRATGAPFPFRAKRFVPASSGETEVPSIAGVWTLSLPKQSSKGEAAWHLIVRQSGPEVSAAVLRVDGDTGALTGTYKAGKFVLSHFSGARPSLFEVTLEQDGTLKVVQNGQTELLGVRSEDARAKTLPQPTDPSRFTSVKNPTEPLRFSFPDLSGRLVSNTDPRFQGKVVLVSISGSWCPNCHDEAPFLAELYRTYRERGFEIVALSFEEGEQFKNPTRLRAFIKRYGIGYTVLLPGEPREAPEKLPQAVNLNSFPTTFFVGRDGLVRGTHAGFPGAASGTFHTEVKREIIERVERLLAEGTQPSR